MRNSSAVNKTAPPQNSIRTRLPPELRKAMILQGAIDLFAENGFSASTRDLARGMGISVALVHSYFASKEDLIAAVYDKVYTSRFDPAWIEILEDKSKSLRERLLSFYAKYLAEVDDEKWARIAMYSGLTRTGLGQRYLVTYVAKIIETIARQVRLERKNLRTTPISPEEANQAWVLHSTFMYALIRKHVHGLPIKPEDATETAVDTFLQGALRKRVPRSDC